MLPDPRIPTRRRGAVPGRSTARVDDLLGSLIELGHIALEVYDMRNDVIETSAGQAPGDGLPTMIGSFLYLPSPDVVEIMGSAGLDAVVIDLEHGAYGIREVPDLLRAADSAGLWSVVRVAENNASQICKVLDFGASCVLVPQIANAADAERACAAARYAPRGGRGAFPFGRSARFSAVSPVEHASESNGGQTVALLLEGKESIDDIDAILCTSADMIFIGPVDLSHSLGVPGEIEHPMVLETVERLATLAAAAGRRTGAFAGTAAQARRWIQLGIGFVAVSVDTAVLLGAYRDLARACCGESE